MGLTGRRRGRSDILAEFSSDGGATFTNAAVGGIPDNTAFYSFVGAKQGGVTRFYCVQTPTNYATPDQYPVTSMSNCVYTLDWGQPDWIALTNGFTTNDLPMYVGMARSDVSTAYVALGGCNPVYASDWL